MQNTYFPSPGRCIYCDATDVELTDEHIVPFGLTGRHIIRDASCKSCAAITSKFEMAVQRGLWGHARVAYDFPTRRKGRRPERIDILGNDGGLQSSYDPRVYPAPLFHYGMPVAGIWQGLGPEVDFSGYFWMLQTAHDERRMVEWEAREAGQVHASFRHCPREFARMLAKIAFGQVITSEGLDGFDPIIRDFILHDQGSASYLVGGATSPAPRVEADYHLETFVQEFVPLDQRKLVGARVHLLPKGGLPAYDVFVGRLR